MERSWFSALMALLISSIFAIVTACGTTGHGRYPLEGFPEAGWKMYPSPTEAGGPGTVIGITDKGVRHTISVLAVPLPSPRKESPPTITSVSHSNLEVGAFGNLVFGPEGVALSASANRGRTVTISFSIKNANRFVYTDEDLEKPLIAVAKLPREQIFRYKKYVVIQEVITGTGIDYELTQDSIAAVGGMAKLTATIGRAKVAAGGNVNYHWDEKNENLLHAEYRSPLNIFYLEHEFDPVQVYGLKEKHKLEGNP